MKWMLASACAFLAMMSSGCLSNSSGGSEGQDADVCGIDALYPCLGNVTAPHVDARATLDALKQFSEAFPYRQSGTPTHLAARDDLAGRFTAAGIEVVRQSFDSGFGPAGYPGENILGFKWGSDRESWIVIGAHYDITEGAVYGAYDDGSGTAMVFQLAAAFANFNTTKTIVFAQFDQEELGLVGANAFITAVEAGKFEYNGTIEGMIDLDMIGITYPHPAHMIVWENSEDLTAKITELAATIGMPADHVEFRSSNVGSSDGAAFIQAGIATAYFFSDWDEYYLPGGVEFPGEPIAYVGTYPWWHKMDTYETMVISAGDEATLLAGFQNTLDVVSPLLAFMASNEFTGDADE